MKFSFRQFCLASTLAVVLSPTLTGHAAGSVINVRSFGAKADGVTDDTAAINAAISSAVGSAPGATVFLPAGTYRIGTPTARPLSLEVSGGDGVTIAGETGTKLLVGGGATAFDLHDSKHLTIRNIIVDRDPLEYSQGTVTSEDTAAMTCDVAIEKGYDDLDAPQLAAGVGFKPFIYPGADSYQQDQYIPGVDSKEKIGDRLWRFHFKTNGVMENWVGKPCLLDSASCTGWCFVARNLQDWTVRNVSYWGGGGQAAWYVQGLTGATTFDRLLVQVPPGSDRLACCAGGGQIAGLRGTLLIENSVFTRIDDDGLDVLAAWNRITQQSGPRTISVQGSGYLPGDHVSLWNWPIKVVYAQATVVSVDTPANGVQNLTLDQDVKCLNTGVGVGQAFGRDAESDGIDRIIDLDTTGQSTTVRECVYQDIRAKCLNLKASNCTVEGCRFYDSWQSPVSASPEWYFEEGPTVHGLVVRGCTFTNCEHSNIEVGTVYHEQMPPPLPTVSPVNHPEYFGHETKDILIEDNLFEDYGAHTSDIPWIPIGDAIRVTNTDGVTIRNNVFGKPAPTALPAPKLMLVGCTNVTVAGNRDLDPSMIDKK